MDDVQKIIQVTGAPTTNVEPDTSYQALGYEDNVTIEIVDSMKSLSKNIISDVADIIKNFNTLKDKYEEFTDFDDSIYQACTNLDSSAQEIEKKVDSIINVLITIVKNLATEDSNLLDDLESLNKLLSGSSEGDSPVETVTSTASSTGGTSPTGGTSSTGGAAATGTAAGAAIAGNTSTAMPDGTTATTETVKAQTAMAGPETQEVKTVTQTPQPASEPTISGNVSGALSPGTTATTFAAQPYNLAGEDYKIFCATVYAEAAEGNSYASSDAMGVASAILNRADAGNWGGNDVVSVVSAKGQFSGYGYQNQKFAAAMSNPDIIPPEIRSSIDRALAGERNTTCTSFVGNGTYNSFR